MKKFKYTYQCGSKEIVVYAFGNDQAKILAQATAIRNGWNYRNCELISIQIV